MANRAMSGWRLGAFVWMFAAGAAIADERFTATLSGSAVVPPSGSTGTGSAVLVVDDSGQHLDVSVEFAGLRGNFSRVELHGPAAPGATAPTLATIAGGAMMDTMSGMNDMSGMDAMGMRETGRMDGPHDMGGNMGYGYGYPPPPPPPPVTSGSFSHVSVTIPAGGLDALRAGNWYVAVTSSANPAGELRGQLAAATFAITPGITGSWINPQQNGHGFEIEVLPTTPPQLLVFWFVFAPEGGQAWIAAQGPITGTTAVLTAFQAGGPGGHFPPNFNAATVQSSSWGTLTFTFTDCDHGHVDYQSTVAGFGSGGFDVTRLSSLAGLSCP